MKNYVEFKKAEIYKLGKMKTELRLEVQEDYLLYEYFVQNYCDFDETILEIGGVK